MKSLEKESSHKFAFGPVPSRRLGQSLGVNNIPPKHCTYSCVYCQVGVTPEQSCSQRSFFYPTDVVRSVQDRVKTLRKQKEPVDYLTFVPDGEPTLDRYLGLEIDLLRFSGIPVAVLTNGSLLGNQKVREHLENADLVSLKVDTVTPIIWHQLNRPQPGMELDRVLEGMLRFSEEYEGILDTETMLVEGLNDDPASLEATAKFLYRLAPRTAYLALPTRPPAEPSCQPATCQALQAAHEIFSGYLDSVESLPTDEGTRFSSPGVFESDLLGITSVHPIRERALKKMAERQSIEWARVETLLSRGYLKRVSYLGQAFYARNLRHKNETKTGASMRI